MVALGAGDAILRSVTGLALIADPVVGAIADGLAWQWSLWINLPIGVTVVPLVLVGAITALALPGRYEMAIAQAKA